MNLTHHAKEFAIQAHDSINQVRKGTGLPYWTHPAEVAEIVSSVPHTDEMYAAAWLHDVVEDTPVTSEEIHNTFGTAVGTLVDWVTDVSKLEDGNRKVRKAMDRDHLAKAPPQAKTIKLADILHNTSDIYALNKKFLPLYISEMLELIPVLKEGDPTLYVKALNQVEEIAKELEEAA